MAQTEAIIAVIKADITKLHMLQENNYDVNQTDADGRTALHIAASQGKLKISKMLVNDLGADINAKDRFGGTPIDDAVRMGHNQVVAFLAAKGAIGGKTSTIPDDAAMACDAAANGNAECLRSLVKRKCNINAAAQDKRTPLHLAACLGKLPIVKILLEEGKCNPNLKDRWGATPLDDALKLGHKQVFDFMKKKGAKSSQDAGGNADDPTDWCDKASKGNADGLRDLVKQHGTDLNVGDYDARTALHLAASEGAILVVQCLCDELGCGTDPVDRFGGTPLDDAIRHGHEKVIEYLESKGAARGKTALFADDATVLMDAGVKGDVDILKSVARQKPDINAQNFDRRTVLHITVANGHIDVVKALVEELGADVNVADRWGCTPLDEAEHAGHNDIVQYLKSKDAISGKQPAVNDDASALCQSAASGSLDSVQRLVQTGVDVNQGNFDGRTAMHLACSRGHLEIVKALVEAMGADTSPQDRWGATPLDDASTAGHQEVVDFMTVAGAVRNKTAAPAATVEVDESAAPAEVAGKAVAAVPQSEGFSIGGLLKVLCCNDSRDLACEENEPGMIMK